MVKGILTECADLVSVLLYKGRPKEVKIITFHTDILLLSESVTGS